MKSFMDLVKTIHRLRFKLDRYERGIAGVWRGFFADASHLWNCASLFKNLTSVFVCITTLNNSEDTEALRKDIKEGRIHRFISFAPNLRILSLEIMNCLSADYEVGSSAISLLDVLGREYVWKRLETFNLNFPPIDVEDLAKFLARHSGTLKSLCLGCVLLNGTWREVLDFLKERLHLTGLELVYLREKLLHGNSGYRSYGSDEQRRMEDYILRGGEPFSPTQIELDEKGWDMKEYWSEEEVGSIDGN
ncbi:hypothetical protein RUND412_004825 [Rhizina undulata]